MNPGFLLLFLFLVVFGTVSQSQNNLYETCREPFVCGTLSSITYPFYGGDRPVSCGSPGYQITCESGVPLINTSQIIYRVLNIRDQSRTLIVARNDTWNDLCVEQLSNTSVDTNLYSLSDDQVITLVYGCSSGTQLPTLTATSQFSCDANALINGSAFFFIPEALPVPVPACGPQVNVRIDRAATAALTANPSSSTLQTSLQTGFSIQWSADNQNCQNCLESAGACGSDESGSFACHCANGTTSSSTCTTSNQSGKNKLFFCFSFIHLPTASFKLG